ncbi:hypothetical protein HZD82_25910, partial [Pantoea agglomerans]|nr:hypothetical protein [Pantoea agglomerans]
AAIEKKLLQEQVDNQFAPLREFVTGKSELAAEMPPLSGEALGAG